VAAAFGVLWLGPRAQGRSLTVQARLEAPACVDRLTIDLTRDRERARSVRLQPGLQPEITWEGRLPADRYRLEVALECHDGARVPALSRPVDLEGGDVEIPITVTASCACEAAR